MKSVSARSYHSRPQPFWLCGAVAAVVGVSREREWFHVCTCHLHKWSFVGSLALLPLARSGSQGVVYQYWAMDRGWGALI